MSAIIERIDSIRFERAVDNGVKVSFSVENPTGLTLSDSRSFLDAGKHNVTIAGVNHSWDSVFSSRTKIILVGKIKEVKSDGFITIYHEGEFDFEELLKGNIRR